MHRLRCGLLFGFVAGFAHAQIKLAPPEQLLADGVAIDSGKWIGHSGPLFVDLDGDGKRDLLVGNFSGTMQVFTNVGTSKQPKFTDKGLLAAEGKDIDLFNW